MNKRPGIFANALPKDLHPKFFYLVGERKTMKK